LAKGRVAVEFGDNQQGIKEVVLWTYLNLIESGAFSKSVCKG